VMRVESVTVCCGYGDFLRESLPINQALVDDLVVITSADDNATREVCRRHSVRCVVSDEHRRGGPFNKARLIQRALNQIGAHDWVLHLDADVVLPRRFRDLLDWAHLDERCIYGVDRCNLVGWDAWHNLINKKGCWDNHVYESGLRFADDVPVATRWVSKLHGYVPIGFFQLFHGSAMIDRGLHLRHYPYHHGDAARTDVQFALQWDRRHRQLLPEVIVLHLESEPAKLGANWRGRTTRHFGPKSEIRNPKSEIEPRSAQPAGTASPVHHPDHHHDYHAPRYY
jgi:Glycosyl transferase family 2